VGKASECSTALPVCTNRIPESPLAIPNAGSNVVARAVVVPRVGSCIQATRAAGVCSARRWSTPYTAKTATVRNRSPTNPRNPHPDLYIITQNLLQQTARRLAARVERKVVTKVQAATATADKAVQPGTANGGGGGGTRVMIIGAVVIMWGW